MQRFAQDLQRASEVEEAHLVMEGEEDLDWFGGIGAVSDCTHLVCFWYSTGGVEQEVRKEHESEGGEVWGPRMRSNAG